VCVCVCVCVCVFVFVCSERLSACAGLCIMRAIVYMRTPFGLENQNLLCYFVDSGH
jgi:hypothetical protein